MEIKPTNPGNINFGNVSDTPAVTPSKPFNPAPQSPGTEAAGPVRDPQLQALAGLGQVSDLNDPKKSQAIVRNALSSICGPEFTRLNQPEKDGITDFMANDPLLKGKTSKLMEKVLRGD